MLREINELIKYHRVNTYKFAEHDCLNVYRKTLRDLARMGFNGLEGKTVLDLGCGQRLPFALQAPADEAKVTALDLNWISPGSPVVAFVRTWWQNGTKRALKSFFRKALFDPSYYRTLEVASCKPLRNFMDTIDFVIADPEAGDYALPSSSFDLIVSNAVIEHVVNIRQFAKEIHRLLCEGGVFLWDYPQLLFHFRRT